MLTNDLDFRLEPRLKELYEQHKIRAQKIDWGYHEFYHGIREWTLKEFLGMKVKLLFLLV